MRIMGIVLLSLFLVLVDQVKFRGYYTGRLLSEAGYYTVQVGKTVRHTAY